MSSTSQPTRPFRVLYVDAITHARESTILFEDTTERLKGSKIAQDQGLETIRYEMFNGPRLRPRNMGRFAREHSVDAVVLSGSAKNTTDREDPWVQEYLAGLRDLLEIPTQLSDWAGPAFAVLGICFGHQALACLLGGDTARFTNRTAVVEVNPLSTARRHPVLRALLEKNPRGLRFAVYHADHVVRLPQDFSALLTSDYCSIQGMAHRDWPIVGLQPHPEMGPRVLEVEDDPKKAWSEHEDPHGELARQHGPELLAAFADWAATIR